jgi:hypothetical protein
MTAIRLIRVNIMLQFVDQDLHECIPFYERERERESYCLISKVYIINMQFKFIYFILK